MTDTAHIARRALGVAVVLLGAALVWAIVRPATQKAEAPRQFTSSEQCKSCHEQAYAEWSVSWHAAAWNDPEVRALSNDFANTDCIDCHAPRPIFETGIGERVLPRSARRGEGVDCIACHMLPEGHISGGLVAGTRDDPSAECRPVAVRDLGTSAFCAVCHDQHDTTKQWKATDYAAKGIGCIDCHMKPRADGKGRDHTMHGGHDIELVRSAVEMRGKRDGDRWVIEVENVGAGHHFPTEERSRASDVFWRPLGATGEPWRHAYRFRSPYHHENMPDTLLPAHETRAIPLEGPDSNGPVEVALFYTLRPYWADPEHPDPEKEAKLVHRLELRP
jgi:hypothetical protein